ncbi:unnamed protein product [Rotaria sp. Silwood2]|nr:unnamed protein product [Rotaria sp. Silwood2]
MISKVQARETNLCCFESVYSYLSSTMSNDYLQWFLIIFAPIKQNNIEDIQLFEFIINKLNLINQNRPSSTKLDFINKSPLQKTTTATIIHPFILSIILQLEKIFELTCTFLIYRRGGLLHDKTLFPINDGFILSSIDNKIWPICDPSYASKVPRNFIGNDFYTDLKHCFDTNQMNVIDYRNYIQYEHEHEQILINYIKQSTDPLHLVKHIADPS